MKVSPVARTESLIVKEVDGETLVYDLKTDKAHCLNETAALVWKNCDGLKSVSEISKVLSADSNASVKDEVVWLALDQLEKFDLLEETPAQPAIFGGLTRRQMVARVGVAAIALPAIMSIVSPTARAAGSVVPIGGCCDNPNDCSSHCCAHDPANVCATNGSGKTCIGFTPSPTGPVCQDL